MVDSRIHYSSFASYICRYYYIKKATDRLTTSVHEAPRESPGRYRLPTYATYSNDVAFREMSSAAPMKYY